MLRPGNCGPSVWCSSPVRTPEGDLPLGSKASSCAPVALTETAQDGIFHWELQGNCTGCRRFLDDAGQRAMSSLRQAGLLSADDPVSRQEVVGRLYLT
ncbi:rCG46591, isoform CRA_c [Rattus norvegicus]|uniref:RCG46591, isoform CRA_c n=1 Tax=Rattus norvegicus TaxID=10116 RepID=A6IXU2_RAT|nr:rCG46591, isoform CRA_c [Rattus norvegicus]